MKLESTEELVLTDEPLDKLEDPVLLYYLMIINSKIIQNNKKKFYYKF